MPDLVCVRVCVCVCDELENADREAADRHGTDLRAPATFLKDAVVPAQNHERTPHDAVRIFMHCFGARGRDCSPIV